MISIWRTPRLYTSSSSRSIRALSHCGIPLLMPAAERAARPRCQDDGELAVVDHPARLERVGDDAEEALARAAVLRVDVVLQLEDALALQLTESMSLQVFCRTGIVLQSPSLSTKRFT
jgi:hypothetical protein